jgi:broad specificity phosphatase PhoE
MSAADALPLIVLARHGQTAWSLSGQHTDLTDLPLTPTGEANARWLAPRLQGLGFERVLCSPLQRARHTCELAGYGARFMLDTASVSALGYEHSRQQPVIRLWNDTRHVQR